MQQPAEPWPSSASEWSNGEALSVLAAPYQGRVQLAFADVLLSPRATLVFSLLFHELATNAAKYGALGGGTGCAVVAGRAAAGSRADDALAIRWCERGGPRVSRPQRTGFGMKLMEQLVTHDLRGQFELRFDPAGIECLVQVPAARYWQRLQAAPTMVHIEQPECRYALLVEDEILAALDIEEQLTSPGFHGAGPGGTGRRWTAAGR